MSERGFCLGMDTAVLMECIVTTIARRGDGVSTDSPIRVVTQVWTKEGALIAERDPCAMRIEEWREHEKEKP